MGLLASKPRLIMIAAVFSILLALPLLFLYLTTQPATLQASHGGATIYVMIDRSRVLFPGQKHGNLTWSGQITLLILFVVSAGFLLREHSLKLFGGKRIQLDWRLLVCGMLLGTHLLNRIFLFIEGMYW